MKFKIYIREKLVETINVDSVKIFKEGDFDVVKYTHDGSYHLLAILPSWRYEVE